MSVSKIVITGSHGFIGSALVNKLSVNSKYKVYPIDHLSLRKVSELRDQVKKIHPDYIFHLSSYGNHSTQTDDIETFLANVGATWSLLEASIDIPYKAFINFGSSSEYGQKSSPMSEMDIPESITMYGCTKVAGTYLARAFAKKYNKPIVTVRPFSVFGSGEAEHRFIPTVIKRLLDGKELTLDREAKHDWIYIMDFLDALGLIADHASLLSGQTINIGTGKETSNIDVVKLLEAMSKKKAKIKVSDNMRVNDSEIWRANTNKLRTLKWSPKWALSTALFETYLHYKTKYYGN